MKNEHTKERLEKIKALLPRHTLREIAASIGCNVSTVHYYVNKYCPTLVERRPRHKGLQELIMKLYATHSQNEIAKKAGCALRTINYHIKRLGLKRTEEEKQVIELNRRANISKSLQEQTKQNERRKLFGLEPLNERYKTLGPQRVLRVAYNLHYRYGYEYTDDIYVLKRGKKKTNEEYFTETYRFKFID